MTAPGPDRPGPRRPRRLDAALVVLLAVAGHAPALHDTGFTIDDHEIVENDPRLVVRSPADLGTLVTTRYWGDHHAEERLWRPTALLSFALDRTAWGPGPDGFHRTNVALHALTSALVLALLTRAVPGRRAPLLGALVFAVHPVHAEATAGIVGRAEVLALLLSLCGVLLHLRAREAAPAGGLRALLRPLPAAACFFVAWGAKEIALAAPFCLALLEVALARGPPPGSRPRAALRAAWPYLVYLLAIAGYFAARGAVLGDLFPRAGAQSIGALPLQDRVLVAAEVVRDSAAALLAPKGTTCWFPFQPPAWSGPLAATVAMHLLLLGWAFASLRRGDQAGRALAAGVAAFYTSLGPVSNIIPIGVVRADRLLYTPSAWFCLAGAAAAAAALQLVPRGTDRRRTRALAWTLLAAVTLGGCAWRLVPNAAAWVDEGRIRFATYERFGQHPQAKFLWGQFLLDDPRHKREAVRLLTEALEPPPRGLPPTAPLAASARAALGRGLDDLGRSEEALQVLLEGAQLHPGHEATHQALAQVAFGLAMRSAPGPQRDRLLLTAERAAREGTRAAPHGYQLWLQWGTILSAIDGREREAIAALDQAVARRPEPWEALFNRSRLRRWVGERQGALDDLRRVGAILDAAPHLTGRSAQAAEVQRLALKERAEVARSLGLGAEADECLARLRALGG